MQVLTPPMNYLGTPGFIYTWGTGEELKCVKGISYFDIINDKNVEVKSCYAAVVTTKNAVIPYSIYVDRYVIAEVNTEANDAGDTYYELNPEWKAELQGQGWLPRQLPTYTIGIDSYLPAIGLISLFAAWIGWQIYCHKQSVSGEALASQSSDVEQSTYEKTLEKSEDQSILNDLEDEQRKARQAVERLQQSDKE